MHVRDEIITKIATYVAEYNSPSENALAHARFCLADALGCALLALNYPDCTKLLGPWVAETHVPQGARIPGTSFILDPVMGAFNFGVMVRWIDYNDTFLSAEWAHPSDNFGGILPLMDFLAQRGAPLKVRDLLIAAIKAYEIQGSMGLQNSFNRAGLDHVILVKLATCAVATHMLGGTKEQIADAISQVFIDMGPLRTYRHAPNTGPRKSWAAGDATSRGVALAMLTMRGEPGYLTPLSAPKWGLEDVLFQGKKLLHDHTLESYIIENVLYKVSFPAEFHAQTAVEAAFKLHPLLKNRLEEIKEIDIHTHEAALRIIDKKGPLKNFADRDHCIQYMVAIGLLHGHLNADHYGDEASLDPRIDTLRSKMVVRENPQFSKDYLDPKKRSIASTLTVTLQNGTRLDPVMVEFPLGHPRRREEGIPLLFQKFRHNLATRLPKGRVDQLVELFQNQREVEKLSIQEIIELSHP